MLNVIPEAWEAPGIRRRENLKRENQLKKPVKAVRISRKLQRVTQKWTSATSELMMTYLASLDIQQDARIATQKGMAVKDVHTRRRVGRGSRRLSGRPIPVIRSSKGVTVDSIVGSQEKSQMQHAVRF